MPYEKESFSLRHPTVFTVLIILAIVSVSYAIKLWFFSEPKSEDKEGEIIYESFDEVNFWFNSDSDLTSSEKTSLFDEKYRQNYVIWSGELLHCRKLFDTYQFQLVMHDHAVHPDLMFNSDTPCDKVSEGNHIQVKVKLIGWDIGTFQAVEGIIENG